MANMANITVKKADGTTDVIYVAAQPSAGDKTPARWTQNAYNGILGLRPKLEMVTQFNVANTQRQARFKFNYPLFYTDASVSQDKLIASVGFEGVVYLPNTLTGTQYNEAFRQLGNLLSSTLIRDAIAEAYAPV